jgi:hypothetical protein
MEENPEVPAAAKDCRDTQTIPFCVERRGRGICPHFEWSGDDCDSPNTCRHLGELELAKARYNIDVDGEGVSHVMLRTCYRTGEHGGLPTWFKKLAESYAKVDAGGRIRAALLMVRFSQFTDEGQIRGLDIFDLLLEVPRFRKPEPEPRPVPTVRLPIKEE